MVGRLDAASGQHGEQPRYHGYQSPARAGTRSLPDVSNNTLVSWSYLDLRPLESEVVLGVRVCVRVEARAEEEYPAPSRGRENSRPSWKSLFLMAS